MSLYDRHYTRGDRGSGGGWGGGGMGGGNVGATLLRWLNASFPIGRYFGIDVRVHILFVLLVIFRIWPSQRLIDLGITAGEQMVHNARWIGLLFMSVLLHEFGHCFGCRAVGGQAERILMWPLGGLAMVSPPRRPWPEFVTVAWGPLVNIIIGGLCYVVMLLWFGQRIPVSLDPFQPFIWANYPFDQWLPALIADLFVVNYMLLLFNMLLVFYPFDGGRFVQIALWTRMGYVRSMRIATTIGMMGAIVVAIVGVVQNTLLLVLIAVFGLITCYQQRQQLAGLSEYDMGTDGAGWSSQSGAGAERKGWLARWRDARALKKVQQQHEQRIAQERQIDRVLEKVSRQGLHSLTAAEKRILQSATQEKRRG